ncbi:M48 family metallopeptidase [Campylobacter anatolicus]|uniref:M48 family metallopeptidase n=1 Tax=Campylobacter anatolicus TaxID=2829105 RepID=UPI001E4314F6|nr:SprT family zinc-dependent metalloprotease [Campylobacter anatolicus]
MRKTKTIFIDFNGYDVVLNFKSNVKNIRLKVSKDGKVSVSLPYYYTQKMAVESLSLYEHWIVKTCNKILSTRLKDDEFAYLGKIYKLKFDESVNSVKFEDGIINAASQKELEKFQKTKAREIFTEFITKFSPLINKPIKRISVRKMQTQWGSCNSYKGYINLNINLLAKKPHLIEYVVLHELTHLIYPHHQSSFYKFIADIMPDFRKRELELNGRA